MCDNTVTVAWALPEPDGKIDHYILEHRRTNHEGPPRIREDYPWMVVEGIREMEHTLTGGGWWGEAARKGPVLVPVPKLIDQSSVSVSKVCALTPAT